MQEYAPPTTIEEAGLRPEPIARMDALIDAQIAEGRYPGAQYAIARHGRLVATRTFGKARLAARGEAKPDTLWLMFSNTKVVTAAALWTLFEEGAFRFTDRMADHVPEFARNGKGDITILEIITHRAGYPNAAVPPEAWADHKRLREAVCNFTLEWTPSSRMHYHGASAHWTLAVLMEALTGKDFRDVIRQRVTQPLGLDEDLHVGVPASAQSRCADMHEPSDSGVTLTADRSLPEFRAAGVPGGGGFATAPAMAALYQMMLEGGALNGTRIVSRRTLEYAIRDWTGDMVDGNQGVPMHRGLGPYLRGTKPTSSHGAIANARVFGHGGAGSSQCWGDPESGVSFAYFSNCRMPEAWHGRRMDTISSFVHAAIL
ncbi:MAG TPA: serine hydrolase domain-containing protein [Acetobacteraceae bacterium]|nr:serine hydrolase domain-containing protein [Acetobacteraceae bacterium]